MCYEYDLIILLSKPWLNKQEESTLVDIVKKVLDWDLIYDKLQRHRIVPIAYHHIKTNKLELYIPRKILNTIKKEFETNKIKQEVYFEEVKPIFKEFKKSNLKFCVLKGVVLQELLYPKFTRMFKDVDINVNDIPDFRMLMKEYDVNLRINTYKPVNTDEFVLTYEEFWNGFKNIMFSLRLVACSEPIVNAVLGISDSRSACGCGKKSLRVNPDGTILPCVYWNKSPYKIEDIQAINENTFDYIRSILITMVDNRTRLSRGLINVIRRDYGQSPSVFHTVIPLSVKAKEATVSGVSVFKHDEKGKITEAYQSLTQEVLSDGKEARLRQRHSSEFIR